MSQLKVKMFSARPVPPTCYGAASGAQYWPDQDGYFFIDSHDYDGAIAAGMVPIHPSKPAAAERVSNG